MQSADCMEVAEVVNEDDFLALAAAPILEECYTTLKEFPMAMIEHSNSQWPRLSIVIEKQIK